MRSRAKTALAGRTARILAGDLSVRQ